MQVSILETHPTINAARTAEDVPLIKELALAYGNKIASGWISKQIQAVVTFVGAAAMTDTQLAELAFLIRYTYEELNMLEFILFCARMRTGRYKEFYGTVDPMAITTSLDQFCKERVVERDQTWQEREAERARREREEHDRHAIPFEKFWANLTEEKREEYRKLPYIHWFLKPENNK